MVLFSVIIATFNRARLLERCLKSVVSCSLSDIEILVADNASPDSTQEVLRSCHDSRLRFWRNETNIGVCLNLLKLLQEAQGRWVFFLTDDDCLVEGALERLAESLVMHPNVGVVSSSVNNIDEQENPIGTTHYLMGTQELATGMPALAGLVRTAHLLSRLTVRREWMEMGGFEAHMSGLYPQMYLVGAILKEHCGLYLEESLVNHTVGNETFWEYHPDFMVGANIGMIRDLLPGREWSKERKILTDQIIAEVSVHHMPLTLAVSVNAWVEHQKQLWRVREVRYSTVYWLGLVNFAVKATLRRIKSKLAGR